MEEERIKLIRENRKAQERIDRFDKMLDDFVEVVHIVPVLRCL